MTQSKIANPKSKITKAFVAQWIEQASPKGKIGVRFPVGAFHFRFVIADCELNDEQWMHEALREAEQCLRREVGLNENPQSAIRNLQFSALPDLPVGALCVSDGEIIGRGLNR